MPDDADLARSLLSAAAVRERAHDLLALGEAGGLLHWQVERSRLPVIADYVLDTMRQNYPKLDIPFHARWRHFAAGGKDRWGAVAAGARWANAAARARAEFDLAIVSVLLDAGAGPDWRYREPDGGLPSRSEGLAIASLAMVAEGAFSADSADPLRVDAEKLATITAADLARGFQVADTNPLVGLEGRAALLNALGRACLADPATFARHDRARPGGLFDALAATALPRGKADAPAAETAAEPAPEKPAAKPSSRPRAVCPASAILGAVLTHFGPIWPSRLSLGGVPLGDTWRHPALKRPDATDGLVPFHKLSQWMSYSLMEPLEAAGIAVTQVDDLTGLPEYRNGGLLIDGGALRALRPVDLDHAYEPSATLIVEWRALTVALLDDIADLIRARLNVDRAALPLAKVLEGGTWAAGRRMARERRSDGSPPLAVISDGTVF